MVHIPDADLVNHEQSRGADSSQPAKEWLDGPISKVRIELGDIVVELQALEPDLSAGLGQWVLYVS